MRALGLYIWAIGHIRAFGVDGVALAAAAYLDWGVTKEGTIGDPVECQQSHPLMIRRHLSFQPYRLSTNKMTGLALAGFLHRTTFPFIRLLRNFNQYALRFRYHLNRN